MRTDILEVKDNTSKESVSMDNDSMKFSPADTENVGHLILAHRSDCVPESEC